MTKPKEQKQIGLLIRELREKKGMTQQDFAEALATSQSAVARMETGGQNFTLDQLAKISNVLGHKMIKLPDSSIDFQIEGGHTLSGSIQTNTSKNGALGLLCASLVNRGKTILHGVPDIEEVHRYIEIMESIGVKIIWTSKHTLEIIPPEIFRMESMNTDVATKTRSFTFVGSLIHYVKNFSFPHSGGCKMGERTIASNKYALANLGVSIKTKEHEYEISVPKKLKSGQKIVMYESSDTGTICALLAGSLIPGTTTIKFAPPNYQVQDVCFFLEKLGVKIDGIGTSTLVVHGKEKIDQTIEHSNSEDPIESMFFLTAGIITKSTLTVTRCPIDFLELEIEKLKHMGLKYKITKPYVSANGRTQLVDITVMPSKLIAPHDKIHTQPFPGIQNDNLPFFVSITTQAEGSTLIHDWTWENRAIYFTELNRLGADVKLLDQHRALVTGPTKLRAAQIICPPALRPSATIFISMLAAEGTSLLRNIYPIARGYEDIAKRLNSIGAKIKVIK